jgi:hypothetical protein
MAADIKYDPAIIQKLANNLYSQASTIIAVCTLFGLVIGGGGGYVLGEGLGQGGIIAIVGAVIIGALGFAIGQSRAFMLKLRAQEALCQLYIEQNTRTP